MQLILSKEIRQRSPVSPADCLQTPCRLRGGSGSGQATCVLAPGRLDSCGTGRLKSHVLPSLQSWKRTTPPQRKIVYPVALVHFHDCWRGGTCVVSSPSQPGLPPLLPTWSRAEHGCGRSSAVQVCRENARSLVSINRFQFCGCWKSLIINTQWTIKTQKPADTVSTGINHMLVGSRYLLN